MFSEFSVTNPASGNLYRVAIRGSAVGENFCSCPDFATNGLVMSDRDSHRPVETQTGTVPTWLVNGSTGGAHAGLRR